MRYTCSEIEDEIIDDDDLHATSLFYIFSLYFLTSDESMDQDL
jgi:hypothetical protein